MAKQSLIAKEYRRMRLVKKYSFIRNGLKKVILDINSSTLEKDLAQIKLQKLPRDSSKSRIRNRCNITGRPHGYYRKFGLSRNKLREYTMQGLVPGMVKASW